MLKRARNVPKTEIIPADSVVYLLAHYLYLHRYTCGLLLLVDLIFNSGHIAGGCSVARPLLPYRFTFVFINETSSGLLSSGLFRTIQAVVVGKVWPLAVGVVEQFLQS